MVLMNNAQGYQTMSLKLASGEVRDAIDAVKVRWEETYPDHVFEYEFFDDTIREFYEGEEKLSTLLAVFTFLAIFIGCLGLFGLATFMTNQRTKEVGVRKALGATAPSIMFLFSLEYVRLIAVGFVIAAPASWYLMNKWLDTFAYRINIGASVFITGFATTLLVALITVGYKSFQAAVANPTKSLRYE
jgi:putative ABC transport system permease protein